MGVAFKSFFPFFFIFFCASFQLFCLPSIGDTVGGEERRLGFFC
jgi:hypothetical protein